MRSCLFVVVCWWLWPSSVTSSRNPRPQLPHGSALVLTGRLIMRLRVCFAHLVAAHTLASVSAPSLLLRTPLKLIQSQHMSIFTSLALPSASNELALQRSSHLCLNTGTSSPWRASRLTAFRCLLASQACHGAMWGLSSRNLFSQGSRSGTTAQTLGKLGRVLAWHVRTRSMERQVRLQQVPGSLPFLAGQRNPASERLGRQMPLQKPEQVSLAGAGVETAVAGLGQEPEGAAKGSRRPLRPWQVAGVFRRSPRPRPTTPATLSPGCSWQSLGKALPLRARRRRPGSPSIGGGISV